MRGETRQDRRRSTAPEFQSTPLMRGETDESVDVAALGADFNPLPSCEGRPFRDSRLTVSGDFNPLPSCEGRLVLELTLQIFKIISIHSPHARGDEHNHVF